MAYSDITTLMEAAVAALADGDYGPARNKALAAQGLLSVLPDTSRSTGGGGSQGVTWDRVALTTFLDRVQRLLNGSAGIQVSKVQIEPLRVRDARNWGSSDGLACRHV